MFVSRSLVSSSIFVTITLVSTTALAQQTKTQKAADIISYGTVAANITLDTIHSYRSDDRSRAFTREGLRIGITIGITELIKHNVSKERPDGSDFKSFPSEHTALAAATQGWNFYIGIPLTFGTATGRVVAKRHDIIDVSTGAAIGSIINLLIH